MSLVQKHSNRKKQKQNQKRQQEEKFKKISQEVRIDNSCNKSSNSVVEQVKDFNNNNITSDNTLKVSIPIESESICQIDFEESNSNKNKKYNFQANHSKLMTNSEVSVENNNNNNNIKQLNSTIENKTQAAIVVDLNQNSCLSKLNSFIKTDKTMDFNTKRNKLSEQQQQQQNKLITNTNTSDGTTGTPVSDNNPSPPIDHSPDLINEKLTNSNADPKSANANAPEQQQLNSNNNTNSTIPSYNSIFNTSYYRATQQSKLANNYPKYNNNNNQLLKKQQATELYSEHSLQGNIVGRKQLTSSAFNEFKDDHNHNHINGNSDIDDNDLDENLPLSNSISKLRSNNNSKNRISPTESNSSPIIGKRGLQITNFDNYHHHHQHQPTLKCNNNNNSKSPQHTKISISSDHQHHHHRQQQQQHTNQPTSFSHNHNNINNCHSSSENNHHNHNHHNQFGSSSRKLDWQESGSCIDCDCNNCYKKFKSAMSHHDSAACCIGFPNSHSPTSKGCSKTESMQMCLKSVILILTTILLTMLFLGLIAASYFMPQAFDKLLTATRSFNVTIQG